MKKLSLFTFIFLFSFFTSSVFATKEVEFLIDDLPKKSFSETIKEIYNFTASKKENDDSFIKVTSVLNKKEYVELTYEETTYLGGIFLLNSFQQYAEDNKELSNQNSTEEEIINNALIMKCGETSALLFSPKLFPEGFQYQYLGATLIYKTSQDIVNTTQKIGTNIKNMLKEENKEESLNIFSKNLIQCFKDPKYILTCFNNFNYIYCVYDT